MIEWNENSKVLKCTRPGHVFSKPQTKWSLQILEVYTIKPRSQILEVYTIKPRSHIQWIVIICLVILCDPVKGAGFIFVILDVGSISIMKHCIVLSDCDFS